MEFDLLAIEGTPFGQVRIRLLPLLVNRPKLYRAVLNPIFITRPAILRRDSEVAQP
jgi:hypothetical protein